MSKTKFKEDDYTLCPYYKKEAPIEIKCEGLCGQHTINVFKNGKEKDDYKYSFCSGTYWNCPLNIALGIDKG